MHLRRTGIVSSLALFATLATSMAAQTWHCGTSLKADTAATDQEAGFDYHMPPETVANGTCSSSRSFFFSAPVAEGNYLVTVTLGGGSASQTTIKAEARRLMVRAVNIPTGHQSEQRFVVNVRRPRITDGQVVKRKPRELTSMDWDKKLTLEFSGTNPSIRTIHIQPAPSHTITAYLAGDSTVVDQTAEPWAAWGQMLPSFFTPYVAISNHAESGETIASFEHELRFAKIFSTLQADDYLFLQFAHNDQKSGPGYVSPEKYRQLLITYITKAKQKGAIPVLVTSMNRRTFDENGKIKNTLTPYPQIMRDVAAQQHITLIDLNQMSRQLYESFGPEPAKSLFVYATPNTFPNQPEALHDDTHFNSYGAYEIARCIIAGLQQHASPLATLLRSDIPPFDPSRPDAPSSVAIPPTPFVDLQKPYER